MNTKHTQMSESLSVALLLAMTGGFLESYSFLSRDGVFANCQTGNMVLMAMNLVELDFSKTITYLIPIFSFFVGVLLTEWIRQKNDRLRLHWRQHILFFEIILLFITGFVPMGHLNIVATTLIAFSCSMQVESFRKVKGAVFATTMCTGNLRSGTYHLYQYIAKKESASQANVKHYFSVIGIFMIGAILGSILTNLWNEKAVWFTCILLLIAVLLMFKDTEQE